MAQSRSPFAWPGTCRRDGISVLIDRQADIRRYSSGHAIIATINSVERGVL